MSLAIAEDTRGRRDYLRVLSLVWLGFGVVALITIPLYRYWQVSITIAGIALTTFLFVNALTRRQRWHVASIVFCVSVDVTILYETTMNGVFAELKTVRDGLESTVSGRTAELSRTVARLEQVTDELRSANRDLDIFSATVAHDLRNPLLVIEGYSRELQEQVTKWGPDATHALDSMRAAQARMGRLIEGLLSFARLGQHALQLHQVPMRLLAERLASEFKTLERGRALSIAVEDLPDCRADSMLMEQVLANLIANAVKFTRPRATAEIRISGSRRNGEVIYSVTDNGVGFSMASAERLFSPLYRLHSQHEFEGTGIGLAAVERMIKLHEGRVWAQSEPNKGATFHFALPVAPLGNAVHTATEKR